MTQQGTKEATWKHTEQAFLLSWLVSLSAPSSLPPTTPAATNSHSEINRLVTLESVALVSRNLQKRTTIYILPWSDRHMSISEKHQ